MHRQKERDALAGSGGDEFVIDEEPLSAQRSVNVNHGFRHICQTASATTNRNIRSFGRLASEIEFNRGAVSTMTTIQSLLLEARSLFVSLPSAILFQRQHGVGVTS